MVKTAEQIAAGLTEAQRKHVLAANPSSTDHRILVLPILRDCGKMSASLVELGIAGWSRQGGALNKLGKTVRAILQAQENTNAD